jgi:hypothetical protein
MSGTRSSQAVRIKQLAQSNQSRHRHQRVFEIRQCLAVNLIEHPGGQDAARSIGQSGDPFFVTTTVPLADNLKLFSGMRMIAVKDPLEFRNICIV